MLIVMDESTHEIKLSEPLQAIIKQCKRPITFLTVYTGIFNVASKKLIFVSQNQLTMTTSIKKQFCHELHIREFWA